jgi:hypothetical protein
MQWLDCWTNMGVAIYGRNNKLHVPGREQELVTEEDPATVADGATAKPMPEQMEPTTQPTTNTRSSQSVRTTRETAMDFWRCLLAVAQVAAAVQIDFDKVESTPMARFHRVGEVFPDAL